MKNKILISSLLIMSLFTNSCATFMTNREEARKEDLVIELDKKLLKSELKPKIEVIENDLKITLFSDNKYNLNQKIYEKGGKNVQGNLIILDFFLGYSIGFGSGFALTYSDNDTGKRITYSLIGAAIGLFSVGIGSWIWASSMEKSKVEEKKDFVRNEVMVNTPFSIKIGSSTLNSKTDERGISFLKDIKLDRKDLMFGDADLIVNANDGKNLTQKIDIKTFTDLAYSIKSNDPEETKKTVFSYQKSDVDTDIPKTGIENKYGVAVIIGNQKYQNKDIPSVEYASNDAKTFKEYVKNVLGYREENIIYLENATYSDFLKTFGTKENNGRISDYIKESKSDIIVYYSGHGAPDLSEGNKKSAYLVPVDAEPSQLKTVGYPLETFYSNLNKLKAKSITVILDSCFSGDSGGGMLIKGASPVFIKTSDLDIGKINVLASASGEQVSSWYPEKKHSIFTYYLLKALKYGNKPDNEDNDIPSRDGKFNLDDLQIYINDKVNYMARKLYSRKQSVTLKVNSEKNLIK